MPIYEYLCPSCGETQEEFFWKSSDAEGFRPKCKCGSACELRLGMPRLITNSSWLVNGRPVNPVDRFKAHMDEQKRLDAKYSSKDRAAARQEKQDWEKKRGN